MIDFWKSCAAQCLYHNYRARKAVILKTVENIRIDTPPENAVTLRAVRFISDKQLKLFQISDL